MKAFDPKKNFGAKIQSHQKGNIIFLTKKVKIIGAIIQIHQKILIYQNSISE